MRPLHYKPCWKKDRESTIISSLLNGQFTVKCKEEYPYQPYPTMFRINKLGVASPWTSCGFATPKLGETFPEVMPVNAGLAQLTPNALYINVRVYRIPSGSHSICCLDLVIPKKSTTARLHLRTTTCIPGAKQILAHLIGLYYRSMAYTHLIGLYTCLLHVTN